MDTKEIREFTDLISEQILSEKVKEAKILCDKRFLKVRDNITYGWFGGYDGINVIGSTVSGKVQVDRPSKRKHNATITFSTYVDVNKYPEPEKATRWKEKNPNEKRDISPKSYRLWLFFNKGIIGLPKEGERARIKQPDGTKEVWTNTHYIERPLSLRKALETSSHWETDFWAPVCKKLGISGIQDTIGVQYIDHDYEQTDE